MASVLIVEDEDRLRRILMLNLMHRGYAVVEATSVETAIEALQTFAEPFDLLLLDINLPDATGWDVLRFLQQRAAQAEQGKQPTPEQPVTQPRVIVMTAVRPSQQRLDEFQPTAVLVKPFPIEALARLVGRCLAASPDQVHAPPETAEAGDDELAAPGNESPGVTQQSSERRPPVTGSNGSAAG
jgi:DNA-binding response OmpR family regulator